jgi:hypothetical protein
MRKNMIDAIRRVNPTVAEEFSNQNAVLQTI